MIRIVHLCDKPHLAATLERWFLAEWAPWYGPQGAGDAAADLAACASRDRLPLCLVAIAEDDDGDDNAGGAPLGTAALRTVSPGSELGLGPWLAGLLVARAQRGRGIGKRLVAAVEDEARRLGFAALYCSTDSASELLERRGWRAVDTAPSLRGELVVYRLRLSG